MAKNRYVSAILNFFVWGLGYIYLGKRDMFSIVLVLGSSLMLLATTFPLGVVVLPLGYSVVSGIGFLTVDVAFAYDAYKLAVRAQIDGPGARR